LWRNSQAPETAARFPETATAKTATAATTATLPKQQQQQQQHNLC